jgi:restriction system protein
MIPSINDIMDPFLETLRDKNKKTLSEIEERLATKIFNLSKEDRNKPAPVGNSSLFHSKVSLCKTYLSKAGLIKIENKTIRITKAGMDALAKSYGKIDIKFLLRYPGFAETFIGGRYKNYSDVRLSNKLMMEGGSDPADPYQAIIEKSEEINRILKDELLSKILDSSPGFFEKLVLNLIVAMGYGGSFEEVSKLLGKSGDEGVDGVIKQDILGLDNIYLQAKRWKNGTVGREVVQSFVGALHGKGAKKGIFITTSTFTKHAIEYVRSLKDMTIILIDKEKLLDYMIKYNIGVETKKVIEIKKVDNDYFDEL